MQIITPSNTQIGKKYKLGDFEIIPLPAIHNVECRAYLIKVDGTKILFATDTRILPKVKNIKIDHFIVEVNYIEELREQVILNGNNQNFLHLQGIYQNHHSLESAVEYFESLDYKPQKILTIHKSNSGLFSQGKTVSKLLDYTKQGVYIVNEMQEYVLEEI